MAGRYVVGIDPGLHGAVACIVELAGGGLNVTVYDMPTHQVAINGKARARIDAHALAQMVAGIAAGEPGLVVQEQVWARPIRRNGVVIKQNPDTMLQLGLAAGISIGALTARGLPLEFVPPSIWKKTLGVSADKEEARATASRLMPSGANQWPLKKHDGRAEAALLALYALRQLGRDVVL